MKEDLKKNKDEIMDIKVKKKYNTNFTNKYKYKKS